MAAPTPRGGILRQPSRTVSRPAFRPALSFAKSSQPSGRRSPQLVEKEGSKDELYAASIGQVHWLQLTLQKTESPTQADINGFSSMHSAALYGRLECLKLLVEKYGVSVNSASLTGWRPIHLVLSKETGKHAVECLRYLIRKNADVNVQNQNGISPLHKAASEGRTSCIKLLLDAGAVVHTKDLQGQEPIDLAKMWGHRECAKYLSCAMWKVDKQNVAREIYRLKEIKKECQMKEEESLRIHQKKLNHFNNLVFSEWLAKKHLPRPPPRILSLLEERTQAVALRKQRERRSTAASTLGEISFLDVFERDRRQRPWNMSSNPTSAPAACIFRPHTVRMGISPDPSVDHDFNTFLFVGKNRYQEPEIRIGRSGQAFPAPALPYETIQRCLYPSAWPSRLRVPQGFKAQHIWDVQSKRPPIPERRWTDQMALSLRQTLDPTFVATLKAHVATYSDAEALFPELGSDRGSGKETSTPSLSGGSGSPP